MIYIFFTIGNNDVLHMEELSYAIHIL